MTSPEIDVDWTPGAWLRNSLYVDRIEAQRLTLLRLPELKKTGRKVPFDRDKLVRSFEIALRKRPVDRDRIERAVSGIVRRLESSGEVEIGSEAIGLQVLEALKSLDDVGFVRYASVYRDFSHAEDFEKVISEINAKIGRDTLDS